MENNQNLLTIVQMATAEYRRDYKVEPNTIHLTLNTVKQLQDGLVEILGAEQKEWSTGDSGEFLGMKMYVVSDDHILNGGENIFFEIGFMGRVH